MQFGLNNSGNSLLFLNNIFRIKSMLQQILIRIRAYVVILIDFKNKGLF